MTASIAIVGAGPAGLAAAIALRRTIDADVTLFERADAHLADREWLAGSRSVADPYLYVTWRWARNNGVDVSGLDNLAAFAARIEADAAVQKVLKDEGLS